jgi:phage protein D
MPEDVSPWVKKTFGAIHHFVPGPELLPTSVSYNLSVNRPQRFERDAEELKREKAAKKKAKAANKATKVAKAAAESREEEQEAEEEEAEEQAEGEQEVTQLASSTPMPRPSQVSHCQCCGR